jgi:hypothetical protein
VRRIKDRTCKIAQNIAVATAAKNVGGAYVTKVGSHTNTREEIRRETGVQPVQSEAVGLV